jgi:hypothetical protein
MRHLRKSLALLAFLTACGSDMPSTPVPEPVPTDPGPVVTAPNSNLGLSADSICMQAPLGGADPRNDDVRITSLTGTEISGLTATITYGPGQPTGWLTTSFDQTTTPARLWLHVTTGAVPEGAWWADVTVSAPDGGEPRVIRMHFTVEPPATVDSAVVGLHLGGFYGSYEPGAVTITGSGFQCHLPDEVGVCSQSLPVGSMILLKATPDDGSFLVTNPWQIRYNDTGPPPSPTCPGDTCEQVVVPAGWQIYVYSMLKGWTFTLAVEGADANGYIQVVESEVNIDPIDGCRLTNGVQSGPCAAEQPHASRSVSMTAIPELGSVFVGWSGDCIANGTQCTIPSPGPGGHGTAKATFAKQ